jgi:thioredoxin 1
MAVIELTEDNFKMEILEDPGVCVVDFWAEWCSPCRMMGPIFDQASEEAAGKAKFASLNVDEVRAVAAEYGVMSIPTLIFFKGGQKVKQLSGVQDKETVVRIIGEVAEAKAEAAEETNQEEKGESEE